MEESTLSIIRDISTATIMRDKNTGTKDFKELLNEIPL